MSYAAAFSTFLVVCYVRTHSYVQIEQVLIPTLVAYVASRPPPWKQILPVLNSVPWCYIGKKSIFEPDVVLSLTHRCNAVRGHRTGSGNSGAEDYLRSKTNASKNRRCFVVHPRTETNRTPQTKIKMCDQRTYVSRYIYI